jgi:hypothetical protein
MMLGNRIAEFKQELRFKLKEHGHEIIVGVIMKVLSIAIVVAATGDLNQAIAGRGRH